MRTFKSILVAFVLLLISSCSPEEPSNDTSANYQIDLSLASENDWEMADDILVLVNEYRESIGLEKLKKDNQYASAHAVNHTNHMISLEQINHDNFHYRSEALKSHGAQKVGENVAYGYTCAEDVVRAWLNSPSHRRAIEGDYTHSGFGVIKSDRETYYFTQLFYKN